MHLRISSCSCEIVKAKNQLKESTKVHSQLKETYEWQISSQNLQLQSCNSEIVDTKNKLNDSHLALTKSEEDKARLTEVFSQLKEANRELKEANTRLQEDSMKQDNGPGLVHSGYDLTITCIAGIAFGAGVVMGSLTTTSDQCYLWTRCCKCGTHLNLHNDLAMTITCCEACSLTVRPIRID